MKKLLNTLYITTQGAYLKKDGMAIDVRIRNQSAGRFPALNLNAIVAFGRVLVSPPLMNYCAENDIHIAFLREDGRFLARVQGPVSGNVLLRREQYRAADSPERSASIVRNILRAKLANSRNVLARFLRDHPNGNTIQIQEAVSRIRNLIGALPREGADITALRGIEGAAADAYFAVFDSLITVDDPKFRFQSRSRRPPMDPVNAMLSFAYTILANEMTAALESVGLDPAVGFLHTDRPGRASLALDLLEEFRSFFADRLVLSLINLKQVVPSDFEFSRDGAVKMSDKARKTLLTAWQERKREEILHPFVNEKIKFGLLPFLQARLLAKHIRGELVQYPPFAWR